MLLGSCIVLQKLKGSKHCLLLRSLPGFVPVFRFSYIGGTQDPSDSFGCKVIVVNIGALNHQMLDQSTPGDQAIAAHAWNRNSMLPAKEEADVRSTQRHFAISPSKTPKWLDDLKKIRKSAQPPTGA
jgi:hypothetical protein